MGKHNHSCGCKHLLRHCSHCDVVYCLRCGQEWGHYYNKYWWPTSPLQTYCGGTTDISVSDSNVATCKHDNG